MRFQTQNPLNDDTPRAPNYGLHPSENLRALPSDGKLRSAAMLYRIRWQATSSHTAFSPSVMHNLWIEIDLIYAIYHAIWVESILTRIILHEILYETILIYDIWSAIWDESKLIHLILHEILRKTNLTCTIYHAIWVESILTRIILHVILCQTNWICFVYHAIWSETQSDLLIFPDQRPADGRGPTENTTPCEGEVWEL